MSEPSPVLSSSKKRVATTLVDIDRMRSRLAWPLIVSTVLNMASFMVVTGFIILKIAENPDSGLGLDGTATAILFLTRTVVVSGEDRGTIGS